MSTRPANGMKVFTILLIGQSVSLLGSGLTAFALGVWAYQTAGSVTDFSLIALAASVPAALLSPVAGAVVDRWNRKTILMIGQTAAVMITAILALLYWQDALKVGHIILLSAVAATFNAFVMPAITASVTLMVPSDDLPKANGMLTLAVGVVRLIAPVVAGSLMLSLGMKGIFIIDLTTFIVGVITLILSPIPQPQKSSESSKDGDKLLESIVFGWNYMRQRKGLLGLLLFFAAISFNVAAIGVLITPMVLGFTDAAGLGIIASISGFGMILGSILIMSWGGPDRKIFGVFGAGAVICLGFILAPVKASAIPVALGGLIVMAGFPIASVCAQTIFQQKVAADVQGRVFGFQAFVIGLASPLALLLAGPLADQVFEPMMTANGALAQTLGPLYGTGEGRGVAVLISVLGIACLLLVLVAIASASIRRIDINLPTLNHDLDKENGRTDSVENSIENKDNDRDNRDQSGNNNNNKQPEGAETVL